MTVAIARVTLFLGESHSLKDKRMKVAPAVKFEVDKVFEQAERVEKLLREEAAAHPAPVEKGEGSDDRDDDGGKE